jgi:hypothetical protein
MRTATGAPNCRTGFPLRHMSSPSNDNNKKEE